MESLFSDSRPASPPGGAESSVPPRILGPDGEAIGAGDRAGRWLEEEGPLDSFTSGVERLVRGNPMMATLASVTVGLVVGMIVGAAVARD